MKILLGGFMKVLVILTDAPYGNEKMFIPLRLIMTLQDENPDAVIRIFMIVDSVTAALPNQITPEGYYNLEKMLKAVMNKGAEIKLCGTCIRSRGIRELKLIDGIEIGNMKLLSDWTVDSDKIISF